MAAGIIETMSNREDKLESALDSIEDCKIGLNNVERNIEILEKHSIEDLREQLSDVEHAKLNVGLAYCLASLMYVSLRSKGRDISAHPVKDDIARIREYVSKLNEVGKSHSAQTKARTTYVDAAAAKRVVSHQIAPNKKQRKK
jgi:nitrate reductase NapAB chaperone NapD